MTHEVDETAWRSEVRSYRAGIAPLLASRQLLAVLIQLAPSFDRSLRHRAYLGELLSELAGLPLAVEFRNATWANDKVFAELEERRVTLVTVDEPELPGLFPSLDVVTNPELFYVRFHGRNAGGWRSGKMTAQFDYDYSDEELTESDREASCAACSGAAGPAPCSSTTTCAARRRATPSDSSSCCARPGYRRQTSPIAGRRGDS